MTEPKIQHHAPLPKWSLALPFMIVLIVFGQTVFSEFQDWDDRTYLLENPIFKLGFWDAIKAIMTPGGVPQESLYIPLPYLSFLVDNSLWGLKPGPAHAINVLLHGLNGALLALILNRILKNPFAALTGAAIFLLHPLQVESVAWAFGRRELLAGTCVLASIFSYIKHTDTPSRATYATAVITFVLALLCKPNVFLVFLALPLIVRMHTGNWSKRSLFELMPFATFATLCVMVNGSIEQGSNLSFRAQLHQLNFLPFMMTEWVARITCLMRPSPYYLRNELTADALRWPYLVVPAILAFLSYLIIRLKAWRVITFGALALLAIAPAGAIILQANRDFYTADRYGYLALAGIAGVVGTWCTRLNRPIRHALAVVVPPLALLAALAILQTRTWRTSETMNALSLARNGNNPIALSFLGLIQLKKGDVTAAKAFYHAALRADPFHLTARQNLYVIAKQAKAPDERWHLRRFQLVKYGWDYVAHQRASELDNAGRRQAALRLLDHAITARGTRCICPDTFLLYGKLNSQAQRFDKAIAAYRRAIELAPERTSAYFNLGMTGMRSSNWAVAEDAFRQLLSRSPNDAETMLLLGVALMNQATYDEAETVLKDAQARMPKRPHVYRALIDLYERSGRSDAARKMTADAKRDGVELHPDLQQPQND